MGASRSTPVIRLPELAEILAVDPADPDVADVIADVIADMERGLRADPDHETRFLALSEDEILEYLTNNMAGRRANGHWASPVACRGILEYWRSHPEARP